MNLEQLKEKYGDTIGSYEFLDDVKKYGDAVRAEEKAKFNDMVCIAYEALPENLQNLDGFEFLENAVTLHKDDIKAMREEAEQKGFYVGVNVALRGTQEALSESIEIIKQTYTP